MKEPEIPITPAVRALRTAGVLFKAYFYTYKDRGGTHHAAESLQVPEHEVVKTLVMESYEASNKRSAFLILMHGDCEVSTKQLARSLGVKTVAPASETTVSKCTGYVPGGVSPFGTRQRLQVYVESTVMALGRIYINGGKRGFLVEIDPAELRKLLPITEVTAGLSSRPA